MVLSRGTQLIMRSIKESMIKFVYFDLGGVVNRDFSGSNKWDELKIELGVTPEDNQAFEILWNQYERDICDKRDVETLIPIIKEKLGLNIPNSYSLLIDGFVRRFEKNESIWPTIKEIQKWCRIGLLTNMYPRMLEAMKECDILPPNINWDIVIDSSIVSCQKPDSAIYKLAEEKAGVHGREILFIENDIGHIEAAKKFNWQTFLYDSKNPERSSKELLKWFLLNRESAATEAGQPLPKVIK